MKIFIDTSPILHEYFHLVLSIGWQLQISLSLDTESKSSQPLLILFLWMQWNSFLGGLHWLQSIESRTLVLRFHEILHIPKVLQKHKLYVNSQINRFINKKSKYKINWYIEEIKFHIFRKLKLADFNIKF